MKMIMRHLFLLLTIALYSSMIYGQDSVVTATTSSTASTVEQTTWYTQPWVWIVGGAVFILLLIAMVRGGGNRSDKVTVTKTVTRDTDV
jgi:hypothetical protein